MQIIGGGRDASASFFEGSCGVCYFKLLAKLKCACKHDRVMKVNVTTEIMLKYTRKSFPKSTQIIKDKALWRF